jgi:hypothetical protein
MNPIAPKRIVCHHDIYTCKCYHCQKTLKIIERRNRTREELKKLHPLLTLESRDPHFFFMSESGTVEKRRENLI